MGFINATSLKRHIEPIKQLLTGDLSYHILGVAETRLGPTVDVNPFNIRGYSIIRQVRNTGGGGVALYMRDTLKVKLLAKSDTTRTGKPEVPEYPTIQIKIKIQEINLKSNSRPYLQTFVHFVHSIAII